MILIAVILAVLELIQYSRVRTNFLAGQVIAGVPVGQLNRQQAAERLLAVYSLPVELAFGDALIQFEPAVVGFELNLERMLAAADLQRTNLPFWEGYWDYIWSRQPDPQPVPLDWTYSETRLRIYLENEVVARYNQPASSPIPNVGTINFTPGEPGLALDVDAAILPIERALASRSDRRVVLPLVRTSPSQLAFDNLQIFLRQVIDNFGFDGMVEVYMLDLQTANEVHFAYQNGEYLSVQPDISFTAASVVKIPIMVSAFARLDEPTPAEAEQYLRDMIELSTNEPADWLMNQVIEPNLGPLRVTEDMRKLGLENTFMAGMFYLGAPLLVRYETPSNIRTDINLNPDPYNQTTVSDVGMLLTDIYQCAQNQGGALIPVFAGQITQAECQKMIEMLTRNQMAALIKAGVPDGTRVAHKHGWTTAASGQMTSMGDAGIVYTPSGNYVLVVFVYHPQQIIWDSISLLVRDISRAIYNYYNLPQ